MIIKEVVYFFSLQVVVTALAIGAAACFGQGMSKDYTYKTAHRNAMANGKPLVVLVSAEWCPPCRVVKRDVLPALDYTRVNFAIVDTDKQAKLSTALIGEQGSLPSFVTFRRVGGKWSRSIKSTYPIEMRQSK